MKKEPHQMRGAELRSAKQDVESQLENCHDPRERQELHHRLEELDAELRRRSQIGRSQSPSEQEMSGGGENPAHP